MKVFFSKFEVWPFLYARVIFQRLRKRSRLQKWTSYWNILKLFSKFWGQEISKWSSGHHNLYKLFFSMMIFPKYIFSSRMTTSFCILPSSPCSKKTMSIQNVLVSNHIRKKNTDPLPCFMFPFSKKQKKQKTSPKKKKNTTHRKIFRLFLRLHEMARSERCQASTPWRLVSLMAQITHAPQKG